MVPQGKWHRDVTQHEAVVADGMNVSHDIKAATRELVRFSNEQFPMMVDPDKTDRARMIAVAIGQYVYVKIGRPRWYISRQMLDLLRDVDIDARDLTDIPFPHDAMCLCFERGCVLNGNPLRTMFVMACRSPIALRLMGEIASNANELVSTIISSAIDSGIMFDRSITPCDDAVYGEGTIIDTRLFKEDKEAPPDAYLKIAVAAILYNAARPEWCVPFTMDRSDRYHHAQPRENMFRLLAPSVKYIRDNCPQLDTPEYHVKPHYRGFVLRHLRADRYYPAGHTGPRGRVVLVPPCAIHPEMMKQDAP